ncbi:MAG: phosphotransferase family protein [Ferrimicrobium sp.]
MASVSKTLPRTAWDWIAATAELTPPFKADLCNNGRSNLTYQVTDRLQRRVILRRPPAGKVLPTAHDMHREFRCIQALHPTGIPVPKPLGYTDDTSLIGAPFYLMEFIDGLIVRNATDAGELSREVRQTISNSLVDTLVRLHQLDPDTVGLGDLAPHEGYLTRQLARWSAQVNAQRDTDPATADSLDAVGVMLHAHLPPPGRFGVVHGDYRLDNVVLSPSGKVLAILDWEIATLGDTVADLGLLAVYWSSAHDTGPAINDATTLPGFATRSELFERYGSATGTELSSLVYFQAFGYWKLACILFGVIARYRAGHGGGDHRGIESYPSLIVWLLEQAKRTTEEG